MSDYRNLILIGGGGFALEIYSFLIDEINNKTLKNIKIKGVIDKSENCELCIKHNEVSYLGNLNSYVAEDNDVALIAVGNSLLRRDLASKAKQKSLSLYSYIHFSAFVSSNAKIGKGVFIGPHSFVSAHSIIEDNVIINIFCGVGHGASIGCHTIMSPYCVINGDCGLGEAVYLSSKVTLHPKIKIGSFSIIDSGCIIRQNIKEFSIVSQRPLQKIFDNKILRKDLSI